MHFFSLFCSDYSHFLFFFLKKIYNTSSMFHDTAAFSILSKWFLYSSSVSVILISEKTLLTSRNYTYYFCQRNQEVVWSIYTHSFFLNNRAAILSFYAQCRLLFFQFFSFLIIQTSGRMFVELNVTYSSSLLIAGARSKWWRSLGVVFWFLPVGKLEIRW